MRREIHALLDLRDRAVTLAHGNIEKRLDAMNEFRAALGDQARTYVSRQELDIRMEAYNARVIAIERYQNKLLGAMVVLSVLIPIMIRLFFR